MIPCTTPIVISCPAVAASESFTSHDRLNAIAVRGLERFERIMAFSCWPLWTFPCRLSCKVGARTATTSKPNDG